MLPPLLRLSVQYLPAGVAYPLRCDILVCSKDVLWGVTRKLVGGVDDRRAARMGARAVTALNMVASRDERQWKRKKGKGKWRSERESSGGEVEECRCGGVKVRVTALNNVLQGTCSL